jgi:type III secretion protein V
MKLLQKWLLIIAARQDIMLAAMLLLAVFMMIIPLPTWLVDFMIALNLTISVILLMMALYIRNPLEFATFPSVLLITTLYRLALTISTTRLILLQADAGQIVYTFGQFAVGGNLGVGLIVFVIITIVQFIVITKGSERVAEVGARFSLDAMPGKQMSIDGDMRAGTIDAEEARRLRGLVQKESQLYGAMDGAMKFVKGDSIAGIIIILVNIFGGTAIGIMSHGMSASEAMSTYAILSIGDGLVSQIPALLISITAGKRNSIWPATSPTR